MGLRNTMTKSTGPFRKNLKGTDPMTDEQNQRINAPSPEEYVRQRREEYLAGNTKGGQYTEFNPVKGFRDVPAYTAEQRFSGGVGEEGLINRGGDVLRRREEDLKGYGGKEMSALRSQLKQSSRAGTAQNIREAKAGYGRSGVSGGTAESGISAIRRAGEESNRQADERALLMQKEATGQALDKYETDILGRQLAVQAEQTGKEQLGVTQFGIERGVSMNQPVSGGGGMSMLCAITAGYSLLPSDLQASEIFAADKINGLIINPYVMTGYIILCGWIARLAIKHKFIAKMVRPFVVAWMRDMAYRFGLRKRKSYFGALINNFGSKICKIVGGIYA